VTRGLAGFFRDNLEAFAVAIALALVIRHYCIEAFRIPTRSMMPTLLGDDSMRRRHGDRILVDKFAYLRREPHRWEVVVFQYPLNRNRNFIKRLIGLPGEWLRLVDGDVWVSTDQGESWAIQRKPPGVRDQLFFPYYPEPKDRPNAFRGAENWEVGVGWRISEREGIFKVDAAREPAWLRFARTVLPYDEADEGNAFKPYAGDVRVTIDLEVERAGTLVVWLTEHGRKHRLVLGAEESHAIIVRDEGKEHRFPVDVRLQAGDALDLSFANVDNTLVIGIDGSHEVATEIPFPDPPREPFEPRLYGDGVEWKHEIALEARGLAATLTDVRIDRDLYYDANKPNPLQVWKVPEDHFLVLGDNTRASKDSRAWKVGRVHLGNGDVITWEVPPDSDVPGQPYLPGPDDGKIVVRADVDGLVRTFDGREVTRTEPHVPYPFVSRDHLIGRAFAIFWPIHLGPVYSGPTRVNLIR
jgi:signal peptidase I